MTLNDCIKFANENNICYLATMDNDQPRVRALSFWFADETGFYFQTGAIKDFPNQLKKNPKTEVCFYKQGSMAGTSMRITGSVEFLNDMKLREKAINDRPYLKNFELTANSPKLIIFRISHGQANFWSMETNLKPKEIIAF